MKLKYFWIQVLDLTLASLKARYRKTWAGFLWVILNPLLMFGVQSLVFKKFLRLDMPDYYLFLLGGLLPWIFFSTTVSMGTPLFVGQAQLLKSFKINPMVLLASQILDNFINFLASFVLILLPFYLTSGRDIWPLTLLPLAFFVLLLASMATTVTLGTLNVFFRDINFVVGFIFQLLFFLTPIFYPREFVPEEFRGFVDFNPVFYIIHPFRKLIYEGNLQGFFETLLEASAVTLIIGTIAVLTWRRKRNEFYRKL
jgi:lipopolysaccharide transport system permease protein